MAFPLGTAPRSSGSTCVCQKGVSTLSSVCVRAGRRASAPETPCVPRTLGSAEKRGHARVAEVHEPASLLWLQLGLPLVVENIGGVELPGVSSRGAAPEGAGLPACAQKFSRLVCRRRQAEGRRRQCRGIAVPGEQRGAKPRSGSSRLPGTHLAAAHRRWCRTDHSPRLKSKPAAGSQVVQLYQVKSRLDVTSG